MQTFFHARQQDDDAAAPLLSEASFTTRPSASSLPLLPFLDGGDYFEDDDSRSSSPISRSSRPQLLLPQGLTLKPSNIMPRRSSRSANMPHLPRSFCSSSSAFHPRQQERPSHAIVDDGFVTPVPKALHIVSPSPAGGRRSLLLRKHDWDCVDSGSSSSKLGGTSLLRRRTDDAATAERSSTTKNGVKRQGNIRSSLPSRILGLTSRCKKHRKASPANNNNNSNPEQESTTTATSSKEKLPFLFF